MSLRRKWIFLSFTLCLFWATSRLCHLQTDGFQLVKIISRLPTFSQWETPLPSSEEFNNLKTIFSQPFYYLGSGGQCYAFISQDGRLVLKLFKMHNIRQYPWLYHVSLPGLLDRFRVAFLRMQKQKLERVFSSSYLAYDKLKEETGLLFLNLNPSPHLEELKTTIVDKIGIHHPLNLVNVPFALQYKADKVFPTLRHHLLYKNSAAMQKVIKEIVTCLIARYQKGILDLDPAVRRNIGLLRDKAITIDIGSFHAMTQPNSPEQMKQELQKDTRRLRKWLLKRSPELSSYLDGLIAELNGDAVP
jgi:hypothetical protein